MSEQVKTYWIGGLEKPICDFCQHDDEIKNFGMFFDAATTLGPWALMCPRHYAGVGIAMGQQYKAEGSRWVKVRNLHNDAGLYLRNQAEKIKGSK
jgi:hypothetical protein